MIATRYKSTALKVNSAREDILLHVYNHRQDMVCVTQTYQKIKHGHLHLLSQMLLEHPFKYASVPDSKMPYPVHLANSTKDNCLVPLWLDLV